MIARLPPPVRLAPVCLVALAVGGCARLMTQQAEGKSPLRQAQATPDSFSLEILFARFPLGDEQLNGELWKVIDEQHLPGELRSRLARNGLRAGLIGSQLPSSLVELLNCTDVPPSEEKRTTVSQRDLQEERVVRRRALQLRSGNRGEILASGILKELPLLVCDQQRVCGRTYRDAQGLFAVQAQERQGRMTLALTPEIQHGEAKQQWNGRDGIFRLEMARPKEVFGSLRIEAALTPGQMLVVSCLPDRPGSLGHHFFTDSSAKGPEQKLLLIRLAQMPPAELYVDE